MNWKTAETEITVVLLSVSCQFLRLSQFIIICKLIIIFHPMKVRSFKSGLLNRISCRRNKTIIPPRSHSMGRGLCTSNNRTSATQFWQVEFNYNRNQLKLNIGDTVRTIKSVGRLCARSGRLRNIPPHASDNAAITRSFELINPIYWRRVFLWSAGRAAAAAVADS